VLALDDFLLLYCNVLEPSEEAVPAGESYLNELSAEYQPCAFFLFLPLTHRPVNFVRFDR
jgi:hypothetical protein